LWSCDPKKSEPESSFDRTKMLDNYANNLIKPAFLDLQNQINILKNNADAFVQNTNTQNLTNLQTAWENAYTAWQYTNAYNIGVASEQGLQKSILEEIATFPISTTKIENAITNNNANFSDFNRDARGFLAIEYLVFSLNDDNNAILTLFNNTNRKNFLTNAIQNLKIRLDNVVNAWNNGFTSEFIQNNGTDVGSSTSILYNEFVKSFEQIKNLKVGLPLGKKSTQIQIFPDKVEAYYSGKTLKMLTNNITAIENIWRGKSKNGNLGISFRDYLANVEGGNALINSTETQLTAIKNALNNVSTTTRISTQVQNSPTAFDNLHTELQKHTRFFKSDMSSLLGIAITYASGDGD
jgi:uncharacterized protein